MSLPFVKTLKSTVAVASAALFLQIGGAAAAGARGDFQQQVRQVLAGTPARPVRARPDSLSADRLEGDSDAQAFARGLLLGVSVSHRGVAASVKRRQPESALQVARLDDPGDDAQKSVRQLLLGQHAPVHGAL